jgi:DNA polymerase III subunit beta
MKFRVERDMLAEAVAWTARSISARPAVPVLAGLLLDVDGQQLTVSGFDYEVSTEASLDVTVEEAGRVLVSGRLLAEITRSLPGQPVELQTEGARVVLTCGSSRFILPTLPVEDYPMLPEMPAASGTVGSDAFAAAIASVAVAAGRDDTLPVLTGVRVEIEGELITFAATDRYRLAVRELPWKPGGMDRSATALVPARTLAETAKSLTAGAGSGAEVTIALATGGTGEGMIGFSGDRRRTTTRLLDGQFPPYRSLLPAESAATAVVDTGALIEGVRRVSLVAARNSPVRMSFTPGELLLEAGGGDEAQASEVLETAFEGEELGIAFNPGYLLDGLGALDSDAARLSFTTPAKPVVITGKEPGDYRYLLMPIRLSG